MGNIFFSGAGTAPPDTDPRPAISAEQADLAVAMAGASAARQAGQEGGDAAAVDALMRTYGRGPLLTPTGVVPMIGDLALPTVITLDVLLALERRDAVYASGETPTWLDLAHSVLCFVAPRSAWEALGRGREAFDLAAFELAGKIGIERMAELQGRLQRAFDAFGGHAADGPDPTPAGAAEPSGD